jgi:phytoene synthase
LNPAATANGSAQVGAELCRQSIAHHSKSFALASRLFPRGTADRAAIVYAFCRRADDAVDEVPRAEQLRELARLRRELDAVYADADLADPVLGSFQRVVRACALPRGYVDELLAGMAMDCDHARYETFDDLLLYCHRVAGVVGLMMCHVMGLRDPAARRNAAHLGIAMQLTNICRDVLEDWDRGRLYVPDELLAAHGAPGLAGRLGAPFPGAARAPMAAAVGELLDRADRFYRSGDRGLEALPWRAALAVRAARRIYAAIGARLRARGCDVTRGRAVVPRGRKLVHVACAAAAALGEAPARALRAGRRTAPLGAAPMVRFPEDVLPAP